MKCAECTDYEECRKQYNLTIKRKHCAKAKAKYVQTNADRIRSMSDEELAEFFHKRPLCPKPKQCEYDCSICWLEWLKQPAEGE